MIGLIFHKLQFEVLLSAGPW